MYNTGIEFKIDDLKSEIYIMKARRKNLKECMKIINRVITNGMNYKNAASKFQIKYALIYKWTREDMKDGVEALKYRKRGLRKNQPLIKVLLKRLNDLK